MDGGTIVATKPVPPASSDHFGAPADRPRIFRIALLATVLGLLLFLLIQFFLAIYELGVIRDAIERDMLVVFDGIRISLSFYLPSLLGSGLAYLTLTVGGVAIAARGHPLLFALPAVAFAFVSMLTINLGGFHPEPVGSEWAIDCYADGINCTGPWVAHPWAGPLVDLTLVLVPGWIVGRRVRRRRWPGRMDTAALAAILVCTASIGTAYWAISVIQWGADERAVIATAVLGLALGVARPWWPWLHVMFAASTAGFIGLMLNLVLWPEPGYSLSDALPHSLEQLWPIVAVGLIASAWQPLAWVIGKLQERPFRLAIAVNALNLVDALMTLVAVRSGGAYESNPVVQVIGLPAKIVLVGLLTWLLYRRKPSALVWPFAALLLVAGYHVGGIFVNH